MGLDAYLYTTTPKKFEERQTLRKKIDEYFKVVEDLNDKYDEIVFDSLERDENGNYIKDKLTPEQKKLVDEYDEKFKALFTPVWPNEDECKEVAYWRKDWDLHDFIVKKWGFPEDDNDRDVLLTEERINEILAELTNGCLMDSCNAVYSISAFKGVLRTAKSKGKVVFYYPNY